ncbi:MAG: hypothetical protein ACOH2L_04150 [Devosia sp.]
MRALLSLPVLMLVALVVVSAQAKDKVKPVAETVSCDGVLGPKSSEALLIETFGKDNVVTGMVPGAEGEDSLGTTVFPNDPNRKMVFGWWDEENRSYLSYVDLAPDQTTPTGARIGMSVAEIEALNGAPFTVGGFWWDYGGYAAFDTGKLAYPDAGCGFNLRFDITADIPADVDANAVAGEVTLPSAEPLLKQLDAHVVGISLGYPYPDELPQTDSD